MTDLLTQCHTIPALQPRQELASNLRFASFMLITVTGLSYKTAPLEIREKLALRDDRIPEALGQLKKMFPGAMILSTCNRFEILTSHKATDPAAENCLAFLAAQCDLTPDQLRSHLYHYSGLEAVRHVFRVASSLDSMVVGESQILGQMKNAYTIAQKEQAVDGNLQILMERAFSVAKKVRTETMIASKPVSVSSVAVDLASRVFGDLCGKTVFVVGAGKMSLLSIQHLRSRGVKQVLVGNRTFEKAVALAEQVNGTAVRLENLVENLGQADIVISSTGAPSFIVEQAHVREAMAMRKNRPMLLVDIAVPRDIDPRVHEISNVFLYDIDNLQGMMQTNRSERQKEAEKAEILLMGEAEQTWQKLQAQKVAPVIRGIQQEIEDMCRREIEISLSKFGNATEEQKQGIEKLAFSLSEKLLQFPFSELRHQVTQPDGEKRIQFIRCLFAVL